MNGYNEDRNVKLRKPNTQGGRRGRERMKRRCTEEEEDSGSGGGVWGGGGRVESWTGQLLSGVVSGS